jgi:Ca2+-binding RTX toxin-like protein
MVFFGPRWTAQVLFLAAACLAWFVAAPAAGAGTVQSEEAHLSFTAGAGEANHLFIVQGPDGYRVLDLGAAVTPGLGCTAVSANEALCVVKLAAPAHIDVVAGDLDDFVSVSGIDVEANISGEDGLDVLEVNTSCPACEFSFAENILDGGAGDDTLSAGSRNSASVLIGGPGADELNGGPGYEIADYSARTNPITADSDGVADDGEAGEGDNVGAAVEQINGGSGDDNLSGAVDLQGKGGNDTLTARAQGSDLFGGPGDDILLGGPRNDYLQGDAGNDKLRGGPDDDYLAGGTGNDRLRGDGGSDFLLGNRGNDVVVGGLGRDDLFGGLGDDTLWSRDGFRDALDGNGGSDRARVDRGLDVVRNVEAFF